ncbi:unnamed protein product [Spirodela intermedia]|uniref:Beta-galactosidase n=1 Tax=Spirodela intermedia TaxID=51605 RepID=A0A7I8J2M8_SPIIN|nr:unnamed protein product [Spirodela intermedia]CAA6664073.1 unnamed protein product [Spirodela intermedia]
MDLWLLALLLMLVGSGSARFFQPFNVSYDHRALIIDGKRRMLISAGIHYPRATPEMWPGIIAKSKEGGADVIQTYVFWNGHEPSRGQYNFEGRYDLVKFTKLVASSGLYLHLRIGPYVCAEWNFGGFPIWLRDIPGIKFRTNNEQFKKEMQRFVEKIVDLMTQEMLFSWQGGPIILLQIENEYGNIESSFGNDGKQYIKWAASMALSLNAGVPWVMCRQTDAPENIIDTCNAFYCDGFRPNAYRKPAMWTEDWNGWYASWGGRLPHRPVEDNAFAVARFFQRGEFFGGTNFGRTAGGPLQITSYDYDAPIDEYGLLSFPKWGHLKDLHAAIKLCEPALVAVDDGPQYAKLGPMQEVHVYSSRRIDLNSSILEDIKCSAFLANIDEHKTVDVKFLGQKYALPPWSVSVLPDCKHVAFNTAQLGVFQEPIGAWEGNSFTAEGILEHLNVTKDISDYLWYVTRINISAEDISFWEATHTLPSIFIDQVRDVARIFVNGQLAGSKVGNWVRLEQPIHLIQGVNDIAVVSETVGLKGRIKLSGLKSGEMDLSNSIWTYQFKKIYSLNNHESVDWVNLTANSIPSTFTWYKTFFDAPVGNDPVAIYLGSMGKGQAWINGHGIGRYWSLVAPKQGCPKTCNYRGAYTVRNLLVIFEETGGDPLKIQLKLHATGTICSKVSETSHPLLPSGVTFASFGNPTGSCQHFSVGKCHAQSSLSIVSKACQGRNSCKISVSRTTFGEDPCRGVVKTLAVEAECTSSLAVTSV